MQKYNFVVDLKGKIIVAQWNVNDLARVVGDAKANAQAMGDANGVFIRNHGVTFCGHSIQHATLMGIFLEKACRHQLLMESSGMTWTTVPPDEIERKQQWLKPEILEASWRFYCRKLKTLEAAHPAAPVSADERIAPWLERFD